MKAARRKELNISIVGKSMAGKGLSRDTRNRGRQSQNHEAREAHFAKATLFYYSGVQFYDMSRLRFKNLRDEFQNLRVPATSSIPEVTLPHILNNCDGDTALQPEHDSNKILGYG